MNINILESKIRGFLIQHKAILRIVIQGLIGTAMLWIGRYAGNRASSVMRRKFNALHIDVLRILQVKRITKAEASEKLCQV